MRGLTAAMIAIVDYDAGNLRSVKRACDAVGVDATFTKDPAEVLKADKVIFPGVGHARSAMETLIRTGLRDAVLGVIAAGKPVLGICVGAQLLLDGSEEGPTDGLHVLPGMTRRFDLPYPELKIPHIGWNEVRVAQPHPLLDGLSSGDELYFVHSYYLAPSDARCGYAFTNHGGDFCCAIGKDNVFATQFHPEKSGRLGLDILRRFAEWDGKAPQVSAAPTLRMSRERTTLSKRVIACLDVRDGKLAKSVKFVDTKDIGDPVEKARQYYEDGLDELVFYDITASSDRRSIMLDVVERVASQIAIPFSVGGGVRSVQDATDLRLAGAEKVNVNSAAVQDPELIARVSDAIGAQSTVLSMDVLRVPVSDAIPSGYEIVIHGGRTHVGRDAIAWAKQGEALGAGELVVNSIDADGTREGYELRLTRMIAEAVNIPVIASGGAGKPEHLHDALTEGRADAALVASMVHYGEYRVPELKQFLHLRGVKVRLRT